MATYQVTLTRSFLITIDARNPQDAKQLTEFYMDSHDSSNESERQRFNFQIQKVEMVENDAALIETQN
jgi:hypothetical protein